MDIAEIKIFLFMEIIINNHLINTKYSLLFYQKRVLIFLLKILNLIIKNKNNQLQELHCGNNLKFKIFILYKLHFLGQN